eukprot:COSAG05_NODE_15411_length_370_cov_0.955720_1_plen_83_part_10
MKRVLKVFIVSDAEQPIPPGNLCREFLCEYATPDIVIVSAAETTRMGEPIVARANLGELYPYPPMLAGVSRADAEAESRRLAS